MAIRQGVLNFLKQYQETNTIARRPDSGRPSHVTEVIKQIVEAKMQARFEFS